MLNKRKGVAGMAVMALLTFSISVLILNFSGQQNNYIQNKLAQETVDLTANRIVSNVYALKSFDKGSIQMNLQSEYTLEETSDGKLNLSYLGHYHVEKFIVEKPVFQEDSIKSQYICLTKQDSGSDVRIKGGKCN